MTKHYRETWQTRSKPAVALFASYKEHLVGAWRWIYVITAVVSLYLNVVVLVAQSFMKVSALNALAPTQSEPPFAITLSETTGYPV